MFKRIHTWMGIAVITLIGLSIILLEGSAEPAFSSALPKTAALAVETAGGFAGPYGYGRPIDEEEIALVDIDVRPDGTGLPAGSGTVAEGAELYALACASCHGDTGAEGPYPPLVNAYDGENWPGEPRTIGNYWPHATTIFGYIYKAMPYDNPQSLTADQVYAVTAWLLYQNEIIGEDAIMDAASLPQVKMPALEKWVPEDLRRTYPYR